ncbi:MAG: amidohydrolase [Chloroflexota bacterium]
MTATLLLSNANVYTMDKAVPRAEAVAIRGDRILAVGSNQAMQNLLAPDGKTIDLAGRTVVPGFVDAHLHFLSYGLSLQQIDLVGAHSLDAALDRVATRAARTENGRWLTGRGWDQEQWAGDGFPNRQDLDRGAPEHPTFLRRKCGHAGWANSKALTLAGITANTPDPDGGEIEREPATGEPTGILLERAMDLVGDLLAEPTHEEAVQAVKTAMHHVHRMGIVGVHNMEGAPALRAFQNLREDDELGLRLLQQIPEADMDAAIQLGIRSGYGDEWIRFGAVKIFSDGALGARTALMVEPYEGEPDNYGIAVASAEHLDRQVEKAARNGLAVHIHAIGDQANRNVLNSVEKTRKAGIGRHLRHRIEHAQVLHPDDLERFVELGVIPSMQPIHCTQDIVYADANWGARSRLAYAWSSLLSTGAVLAFGSDAPVETPDVLQGIFAAVTRRRADGFPGKEGWYPEECLSVEEAVYAYTMGAAYSGCEEAIKGSLTSGKLADITVLDQNIFKNEPESILETEVSMTIVGGVVVYENL